MKEFRLGKGYTAHYSSFEEVAQAFGCKPVTKRTKDTDKLAKQQEAFLSKHKCKGCGQPMTFINETNVLTCCNPNCRGIKVKRNDSEGNTIISYVTPYHTLDDNGAEIANNIFSD